MLGSMSINGIVSGLKTDEIIGKLMELERMPITRLETKRAVLNSKVKAWQDLNTRMLAFKTKADALASGSAFQARSFTSSDESILRGTTVSGAQAGTYYVNVNSVARAEQQKSVGFADTTSASVGTGSISIRVGSGDTKTINITDANNSLAGVRDAINRAGAGVTASILNDGSPDAPYRLVITSNTMGQAGGVTIDTSGLTGGTDLGFTTLQAGQDASVTFGEGEGALTVTRNTNDISGLIPGVTLKLQGADAGKTVTVTVENDTAAMKQAVKDFVDQYNNLMDFINQQFKYNTSTNAGGTLFSDPDLQMIQSDIVSKMSNPVSGLDQPLRLLSQIGLTSTTSDNRLTIEDDVLDEALATNLDAVVRLMSATGEATDGAVSYISCSDRTRSSGLEGYAIQITAVATQAQLTAGAAQTEPLAQDEVLTINGKSVQLTAGMTPEEVLAAINARSSELGVTASRVGGNLILTSNAHGSKQSITATSDVADGGSGIGLEGFSTSVAGTDVAGTINGEPATGSGQTLTGDKDNANTAGLRIRVSAQSPGSYGTVSLTRGMASLIGEYLDFITAAGTGTVKTVQDSINSEIKDIGTYITDLEARVAARQERLIRQFAAMESSLSRLQGQGSYLSSQMAAASANWKQG